ncbi:MAG: hypothetical protein R3E96_06735 [Planctomycetota bacterium]
MKRAEQFLERHCAFRRPIYQAAVRGLIERPGDLCAPAVGLWQVLDLRRDAEAALPDRFDQAFVPPHAVQPAPCRPSPRVRASQVDRDAELPE